MIENLVLVSDTGTMLDRGLERWIHTKKAKYRDIYNYTTTFSYNHNKK